MISAIASNAAPLTHLRRPAAPAVPLKPEVNDKPTIPTKAGAVAEVEVEKSTPALKPFAEVAREARAVLDAAYIRIGKPDRGNLGREFSIAESDAVGMEKLDRRTLFAIASNEGGLFSNRESVEAEATVSTLMQKAMLAASPNMGNPYVLVTKRDHFAWTQGGILFLEAASAEEKVSLGWAKARGNSQFWYNKYVKREKEFASADLKSDNQVVQLFAKAHDEQQELWYALNDPSRAEAAISKYGFTIGNWKDEGNGQKWMKMPSWSAAVQLWEAQNKQQTKKSVVSLYM